jgi:hypothetical protein
MLFFSKGHMILPQTIASNESVSKHTSLESIMNRAGLRALDQLTAHESDLVKVRVCRGRKQSVPLISSSQRKTGSRHGRTNAKYVLEMASTTRMVQVRRD